MAVLHTTAAQSERIRPQHAARQPTPRRLDQARGPAQAVPLLHIATELAAEDIKAAASTGRS